MTDAVEKSLAYSRNISLAELERDRMRLDAILFNLQVVGKAAKKVPETLREQYPEVEWRKIAGLRDIIAHSCFSLDHAIIWDVLQNNLPELHAQLAHIMQDDN